VLEIVEREAIGGCGCAQAYAILTNGCMCWVLVSMGSSGGKTAGVDTLSMPPDGSRRERRSVLRELRRQDAGRSPSIGPS
jgi:hypothetical protein